MVKATKLASLIVCYVECDVKVYNVVRTVFDEIEAQQRGGRFLKPNGNGYWLNKADLRKASLRPLLLKDFKYCSPDAHAILSDAPPDDDLEDDVELICEHVIPCSVIETLLKKQHAAQKLTPENILEFHARFYRRCLVTKNEDGKLSRSSMPNGWKIGDDIFARYHAAGFDWAKEFS